tara:strand:+ start:166 stop:489 length:324 start_codon:yes stop_codon:yes gene_type:complete
MAIDFSNPKEYLESKLDDLTDGIGETYGTKLMEELISRLETTITDFNNEMEQVFEHLKTNESNRQEMLRKIKSGEPIAEEKVEVEEKPSKPAWEDKIDKIENKKSKK